MLVRRRLFRRLSQACRPSQRTPAAEDRDHGPVVQGTHRYGGEITMAYVRPVSTTTWYLARRSYTVHMLQELVIECNQNISLSLPKYTKVYLSLPQYA